MIRLRVHVAGQSRPWLGLLLERGSRVFGTRIVHDGSLLRLVLVLWSRFWAKAGAAALTAMPMPTAPTTRRRDNALLSFSSIAQSRALKPVGKTTGGSV
jgi:hypothetical protein